jgi:hypothetical protein
LASGTAKVITLSNHLQASKMMIPALSKTQKVGQENKKENLCMLHAGCLMGSVIFQHVYSSI